MDGEETVKDQLDYGHVVMYYEVWNETYNDVEEIPIRPCTL